MAETGGAGLLPIPRGAGQPTQAKPIPRAVAAAVAADIAPSGPEAATDVGAARTNLPERGYRHPAPCILIPVYDSTCASKVGAVCGNAARTDLCVGRPAMAVPTATRPS